MKRLWITVVASVFGIAAIKTILVARFFLAPELINLATVSGLFALFTILTAGVAYLAISRLTSYLEHKHFKRLSPGGGETASKEEIIRRYAQKWGLSKAELDVAIFAAKGFSNTEIADMRGSTVPTVKTQLSQIFRKSALENRYQLIAFVTDEVCVMAGQADNQAEQSQKASAKTPIVVPMVRKGKPAVPQIFLKRKLSNG